MVKNVRAISTEPKSEVVKVRPDEPCTDMWFYQDEKGRNLFRVVRYDRGGKKTFSQQPWVPELGGWVKGPGCMKGVRRVLYRLPQLLASEDPVIWHVEGEKCADRLVYEGLTATTSPGGAQGWREEYAASYTYCLRLSQEVLILPDNDQPGEEYAYAVGVSLRAEQQGCRIVRLPDLPEGGDVVDWLNAGNTVADLKRVAGV